MKNVLATFLLLIQVSFIKAQTDSLKGFDTEQARKAGISEGLRGNDLQRYCEQLKRNFINYKYGLPALPLIPIGLKPSPPPVCDNEDFEASPSGSVTQSSQVSGWTITRSVTTTSVTICNIGSCCAGNPAESEIITIPPGGYLDTEIGPLYPIFSVFGTSTLNSLPAAASNSQLSVPLLGDKVLRLNSKKTGDWSIEKLTKTFSVTPNNSVFSYAFLMVLFGGHLCCESSSFLVKITSVTSSPVVTIQSFSVNGLTSTCTTPPLLPFFNATTAIPASTVNPFQIMFSQWNIVHVNLLPYLGQIIRVEITAADCNMGGHYGYTYVDAACGNLEPLINGLPVDTGCTKPATVSVNTTINNYFWSGPGGFTTSASSFTTNTQGIYTLTSIQSASLPVLTQTLEVKFQTVPVNVTTSNSVVCIGEPVTLQANGLNSYTWSTGQNTASITVTPPFGASYTVSGQDTAGCAGTGTISVKTIYCVDLADHSFSDKAIIFPNPNKGEFTIQLNKIALPARLLIYDAEGRVVHSQKMESSTEIIPGSKLPLGKYFIRISSQENNHSGQFLIE